MSLTEKTLGKNEINMSLSGFFEQFLRRIEINRRTELEVPNKNLQFAFSRSKNRGKWGQVRLKGFLMRHLHVFFKLNRYAFISFIFSPMRALFIWHLCLSSNIPWNALIWYFRRSKKIKYEIIYFLQTDITAQMHRWLHVCYMNKRIYALL